MAAVGGLATKYEIELPAEDRPPSRFERSDFLRFATGVLLTAVLIGPLSKAKPAFASPGPCCCSPECDCCNTYGQCCTKNCYARGNCGPPGPNGWCDCYSGAYECCWDWYDWGNPSWPCTCLEFVYYC